MQPDITGTIESAAWKREEAKWQRAYEEDAERVEREAREARDEAKIKRAASVVKGINLRRVVIGSLTTTFPEVEHNERGEWWQVGPYIVAAWIGRNGLPYATVERLALEDAEKLGGAWRLKTFRENVGAIGEFRKPTRIGDGWIRVDINTQTGDLMIEVSAQQPRY